MSEAELRILYSTLVEEAIIAFSIDFSYSVQLCSKARAVESRKLKRLQRP